MSMASNPSPSTSTDSVDTVHEEQEVCRKIKIPTSRSEFTQLKQGHREDDNSDIAYMSFPLYVPNLIFSILSVSLFIGAVSVSLFTDWIPPPDKLKSGFIVTYGASRFACHSNTPIEPTWLPSIMNLFEVNVIGNVLFRLAVGLPMAMRVFNALTMRCLFSMEGNESLIFRVFNELLTPLMLVEVLSLTLFAIITVHSDFEGIPIFNKYFKMAFSSTAVLNMFFTLALLFTFTRRTKELIDVASVLIKSVSFSVFAFTAHQVFHEYQVGLPMPYCHSYVPFYYAILEYSMIAAYGAFHLSTLIDIRHAHLICYPRTCSGECEPVDPANFQKGGKYEHCRSFEHNQRRIMHF